MQQLFALEPEVCFQHDRGKAPILTQEYRAAENGNSGNELALFTGAAPGPLHVCQWLALRSHTYWSKRTQGVIK